MSTYKRLFTFGCSFTSYTWKTWADILGQQAEEFYNFGQIGGGNEQIFFKIIEANKKYKFTNMILWQCAGHTITEKTYIRLTNGSQSVER